MTISNSMTWTIKLKCRFLTQDQLSIDSVKQIKYQYQHDFESARNHKVYEYCEFQHGASSYKILQTLFSVILLKSQITDESIWTNSTCKQQHPPLKNNELCWSLYIVFSM